jgi:hypothetical protein
MESKAPRGSARYASTGPMNRWPSRYARAGNPWQEQSADGDAGQADRTKDDTGLLPLMRRPLAGLHSRPKTNPRAPGARPFRAANTPATGASRAPGSRPPEPGYRSGTAAGAPPAGGSRNGRSPWGEPVSGNGLRQAQNGYASQKSRSQNGHAGQTWQASARQVPPGGGAYVPPRVAPGQSVSQPGDQRQQRMHALGRLVSVVMLILSLVLLCGVAPGIYGFAAYQPTYNSAIDGTNQLKAIEGIINNKNAHLFDSQTLSVLQKHVAAAQYDFAQIEDQLNSSSVLLSVGEAVPVVGGKLSAYVHLARVAYDLTTAGNQMISAFMPILQTVHGALGGSQTAKSPPLTMAQVNAAQTAVQQATSLIDDAAQQEQDVPATILGSKSSTARELAKLNKDMPKLRSLIDNVAPLMSALPFLLGVGSPTSYLVVAMDSTELRPTGGFQGNYGILTMNGGHLEPFTLKDIYSLDCPDINVKGCPERPVPSQFSWYHLSYSNTYPTWGLRDANLSPDFPTSARVAEGLYTTESGGHVDGMIAMTPAFISSIIEVTGNINVSFDGLTVTVTPQNLEDEIHYFESTPQYYGPNGDRKVFTSALGKTLMAQLHHLPSGSFSKLAQIAWNALKTKDLQIYVNNQGAEQWLMQNHIAGAIEQPQGDSLVIIDTNVIADKTNADVTEQITDQITLDKQGGATHHLTIFYNFPHDSHIYGEYGLGYKDYIRVYAPSQAQLESGPSGCDQPGEPTQSQELGHQVWACEIYMQYAPNSRTVTLTYYVPNVVQNVQGQQQYSLLVQKQAGTADVLDLTITLPSGSSSVTASAPLKVKGSSGPAQFSGVVNQDMPLWVHY